MKLIKSRVVFDPEQHTYTLGEKELSGITPLIKKHICPDKYSGIPDTVLDRAAERGNKIHGQIELLDSGFAPLVLPKELVNYQNIKKEFGLKTLANEYIVSDNETFASGIDLVFTNGGNNIILADIKTTYVLDLEYVKWQLSIYAYLFELQNPHLTVFKLYALWLRDEKSRFEEVERIDTKEIQLLLQAEKEGRRYEVPVSQNNTPVAIIKAEKEVFSLEKQIKELIEKKKELSDGLLQMMSEHNIKSFKGELITLSRKAESTREDLDKAKLKEEHPEIYGKYIKKTKVKESLTIKLN